MALPAAILFVMKNNVAQWDAVIVPGGGLAADGAVPEWVAARLDRAMDRSGEGPIIVLSAGTPHKTPPLDVNGKPVLECVAEAKYLLSCGAPAHRVLMENASYDTIGNAYFSRVIHVDPAGFKRLLIITSEFHMPRTEAAFRWIYGLIPRRCDYQLHFETVPDVGLPDDAVRARREREQQSLNTLRKLSDEYRTVSAFHAWLFRDHGAYRAAGAVPADISQSALNTY